MSRDPCPAPKRYCETLSESKNPVGLGSFPSRERSPSSRAKVRAAAAVGYGPPERFALEHCSRQQLATKANSSLRPPFVTTDSSRSLEKYVSRTVLLPGPLAHQERETLLPTTLLRTILLNAREDLPPQPPRDDPRGWTGRSGTSPTLFTTSYGQTKPAHTRVT